MKRFFYTVTIILLLVSCKENERIIEKIDFKTEYKFSSEIEGKIAKDTVSWKYQISASDYATKRDYKNAISVKKKELMKLWLPTELNR